MSEFDCHNELVQRQRRGELSKAEATALEAHLRACETCRIARTLGSDFDRDATLEADDGPKIALLSELARQWSSPPAVVVTRKRFSGLRARSLMLAAAFTLLLAAGASAAFDVFETKPNADAPVPVLAVPPSAPRAPRLVPRKTGQVVAAPVPSEAPSAVSVKTAVRVEESASRRFAAANDARRAGDSNRAAALYREVVRDFPGSAEAGMSELRLGNLLLEKGKAGAALDQFQRHLKRSGALVPEALYGRGRALAALDERSAERQTWQRVLREYPGSPYAAHARRRLETLNGADNGKLPRR
jgi:TolA-binding protein